MPTYQFEAIDQATGKEIRDTVDAANEAEAQATIRSMGLMVTKLKAQRAAAAAKKAAGGGRKPGRSFAIGGVKTKELTLFTRQLSILQDAGLPILRSLKLLAEMQKPGRLKNSLRRDRGGGDAVGGDGQEPQGLQPAVLQHDPGRRGRRCAGGDPAPPG